MRKYTLLVSVVAHVGFVCLVFVTAAVATGELPDPRSMTTFVVVAPPPPAPPPPAPVAQPPRPQPPAPLNAAPIVAPSGITPEPPVDPRVSDIPAAPYGDTITGTPEVVVAPPPPPPVAQPLAPVRVGGSISPPQRIVNVAPEYPAIARASRVEGVVILEATIAADGSVQNVRVLRSPPLLEQAAVDAVRQWKYTPTLLNGQPVAVVMTVTVAFNLR